MAKKDRKTAKKDRKKTIKPLATTSFLYHVQYENPVGAVAKSQLCQEERREAI